MATVIFSAAVAPWLWATTKQVAPPWASRSQRTFPIRISGGGGVGVTAVGLGMAVPGMIKMVPTRMTLGVTLGLAAFRSASLTRYRRAIPLISSPAFTTWVR